MRAAARRHAAYYLWAWSIKTTCWSALLGSVDGLPVGQRVCFGGRQSAQWNGPINALQASASDPSYEANEDTAWEATLEIQSNPYMMHIFSTNPALGEYLEALNSVDPMETMNLDPSFSPLWEQVRDEATAALSTNPEAGPQLYMGILSQHTLIESIVTVISHEIATELIPATALKNLFLDTLTAEDIRAIFFDLLAAATRSASVENAMSALLFHQGFHALVCYRLGHRLWLADRGGLAYYMQSTVSRKYSADIHPAAKMGIGIHLRANAGIVIGETAVVGDDSSIMQGVTLGGTGKEAGDRHPKLGKGVLVEDGASILGNIPVGDGAIVTSKSIVTKPVPPLAIVSGVPAKLIAFRTLTVEELDNDLQRHLVPKYLMEWQQVLLAQLKEQET